MASRTERCKLIHGYSLGFKVILECDSPDERNCNGLYDLKSLKIG